MNKFLLRSAFLVFLFVSHSISIAAAVTISVRGEGAVQSGLSIDRLMTGIPEKINSEVSNGEARFSFDVPSVMEAMLTLGSRQVTLCVEPGDNLVIRFDTAVSMDWKGRSQQYALCSIS
jgi:hypothetical protein